MMLRHLNKHEPAKKIHASVMRVLQDAKYLTPDLGGKSSTTEYTNAVISNLKI